MNVNMPTMSQVAFVNTTLLPAFKYSNQSAHFPEFVSKVNERRRRFRITPSIYVIP
jgi:hypothetical protein